MKGQFCPVALSERTCPDVWHVINDEVSTFSSNVDCVGLRPIGFVTSFDNLSTYSGTVFASLSRYIFCNLQTKL